MKEKSILFSKERLLIILNQLKNTSLKLDSVLLENYYETIRLWTIESPREVWNVLVRFQDKQYIQKIVPTIFNEKRIQKVVLKKVFPKYYELIKELEIIIDTISDTKIENDDSSTISISELKNLENSNYPKKSKRRPKSEKNTVSLDI